MFSLTKTKFPLNSFQQMMLKWNVLTPYNAGHVIHLSGECDLTRWEKMTLLTIQELKLGHPKLDENNQCVSFEPLNFLRIETPLLTLDEHINVELNHVFLNNDFPIRFFIIYEKESYYFGAIYNHWLADSYAMRALLQRIFERYQKDGIELSPLRLDAPSIRSLFKRYLGRFPLFQGIKEFIKYPLYFQSVYRPKLNNPLNFQTGFDRCYLSKGLITQLYQYAKNNDVTINDLFLSALGQTFAKHTYKERAKQKRKKFRLFPRNRIALGTIVDMRHQLKNDLNDVFGQYLSNYTVILKSPDAPFDELLSDIARQTQKIKKTYKTIKNFASWDISLWIWKFLSSQKNKARFFNKNAPIMAGISNVNLTQSWIGESNLATNDKIIDYIRISPTGLLLPIVFTITTLHQQLSLCISYRLTAFSNAEVEILRDRFIEFLSKCTDSN